MSVARELAADINGLRPPGMRDQPAAVRAEYREGHKEARSHAADLVTTSAALRRLEESRAALLAACHDALHALHLSDVCQDEIDGAIERIRAAVKAAEGVA